MRERLLAAEKVTGIRWQDGVLHLLDQRLLPSEERWLACDNVAQVAAAIRDMVVRGASAIGIAAAYGLVLALEERLAEGVIGKWTWKMTSSPWPKRALPPPTCSGR